MTTDPVHVALLLAAGASRRLGRPKQLELIDGETLIRRVARAALATRPVRLYVALGAEITGCTSALAGLPLERVAEVLGLTRRTIDRDWQFARAYLLARLSA